MMQVRTATAQDFATVAAGSTSRAQPGPYPRSIDWPYSLYWRGECIMVACFQLLTATTALAWFDWTAAAVARKHQVWRSCREMMDHVVAQAGLKRLMAVVRADFPQAQRTVEHLGFEREAELPRFFDEDPGLLYGLQVRQAPGRE